MLGLAIESSGRTASAALWRWSEAGVDLLADASLPPEVGKADQLITVVERLLYDEGLGYADLNVIAVNRGPGSFTGIRSAVALARALALATELPVVGVTSHEALAAKFFHDHGKELQEAPVLIAFDARRGEVYAQPFSPLGKPLGEIEARSPSMLAGEIKARAWRVVGDGAPLIMQVLDARAKVEMIERSPIEANAVALAACVRLSAGDSPSPGDELNPLYIRPPDAMPPAPLVSRGAKTGISA